MDVQAVDKDVRRNRSWQKIQDAIGEGEEPTDIKQKRIIAFRSWIGSVGERNLISPNIVKTDFQRIQLRFRYPANPFFQPFLGDGTDMENQNFGRLFQAVRRIWS